MKDKLGQDIQVGSYIAYGHALGRCAALKIGKVLKLATKEASDHSLSPPIRITVIGVDDDFVWEDSGVPLKLSKIGTLMYPSRVLVLSPKLIPEPYKALMDSFEWKPK